MPPLILEMDEWFSHFLHDLNLPLVVHSNRKGIIAFIILHEKFLQFDWLRAVVFQPNLKYLHVKITNLLRVVV